MCDSGIGLGVNVKAKASTAENFASRRVRHVEQVSRRKIRLQKASSNTNIADGHHHVRQKLSPV